MKISKTHFYEIHELNQIIQELEYSPMKTINNQSWIG